LSVAVRHHRSFTADLKNSFASKLWTKVDELRQIFDQKSLETNDKFFTGFGVNPIKEM